ncbi:MAG TPA: response regulator [Ignavibacteriaceae bacterium]|nr:response regulator [Ignavibacteriaceae bacterium]
MQISKIESLAKYNKLLDLAVNSSNEFPNNLSEFLVEELEIQAIVIFKISEDENLLLIGKSEGAKKAFTKSTSFACSTCKSVSASPDAITFNNQPDCEIQTSDFVIYEGCLHIKVSNSEKFLLKIAKKSAFSKSDKDNLEMVGRNVKNLFKLWGGNRSTVSSSLSEIINEIAHELRTPTNSIMGFASLLNEDNLTDSQSEYVNTLKDNAYNLLGILNDIIELSKIDIGKSKTIASNINVKSFIDEIIKQFTEKKSKQNIEFLINIDQEVSESVKVDSQKLRYILLTVLTYSCQQTEKGKISISISNSSSKKINFKISDTSPGITTTKLKDIFKPFSIAELGDPNLGSASGLGLILSKKYAELLNGEFDITSSVGKGTTYNLSVGAEALSTIESSLSSLPKPSTKKNRVLVVEDDYATSKLLSNYLNKWGYEPTIVNSAEQALKAVDKEIFLAVLMDIVLPDANGFELLKTIREHKNAKNTPVIVCSVEAEQQKAFLMGAVEYFVKPIKYKYLVEVLTSYKLKRDSNILIVDDDVPTLNLIKEAIEQAGYNPIAESHSSKVLDLIENMNLDLAIIDLDMPEINGFDLIKAIKSKPAFSKLPIIIYTGKESYQEDLKKIDGMFADLLRKSSTNIEELSETINQMINRYDEPSTPEEIQGKKDTIKILLVEDYKHSQIIVTRLLKKNNFESIVVVENGAEALDQVKKQRFNLILMDMQMPVMNGFEATEKIRQLKDYKDTPIIALTAFAMKGDREKCIDAGATDYIPKPIDSHEFIEKVKYYTESKVSA